MNIPFPAFEPDKSQFTGTSSNAVINAFPVADGWGPMPGLTEISVALPAECRGAAYVRNSSGAYTIIAGTTTNLYRLDTTAFTWTDISGPAAPYAVPLGDSWTFTVFGTNLLIHNITNPIQTYDIESAGVCSNLAGSPPNAKYSWVAGDFVVLGYLSGTRGEKKVQWCGQNDSTFWNIGFKSCDFQELPEGDEIMGGYAEVGGFTVIQRNAIQSFPFAPNSGFTFTRTIINPKQGCIAPRSIVSIGPNQVYYLAEDGFFSGVQRTSIGGERVDRWFLKTIDTAFLQDVQGAADPYEKIVWWKFQIPDGTSRRLGYDWQLDRWCTTDLQVGEMMALATPGVTWDGMAVVYRTPSTTVNLITFPESFDNAAWTKTNASVTANATTAPDGTLVADKLIENATAGVAHNVSIATAGLSASQPYTISVYAKKDTRSAIALQLLEGAFPFAFFDLNSGVVSQTGNGATGASITALADNWYRCSVSFTAPAVPAGSSAIAVYLATGLTNVYNGDGVSGLYIWGAQFETGAVATPYIPISNPAIDGINIPFDSRVFLGGRPTMATFTTGNKLAFFAGPNLEAKIQTATLELMDGQRTFVNGLRVVSDSTTFTITDTVSAYHGAPETTSAPSSINRAGYVPMRSDGRLHRFALDIPAGASWSIVSSLNADPVQSGEQ